jgi:hypothetical protein
MTDLVTKQLHTVQTFLFPSRTMDTVRVLFHRLARCGYVPKLASTCFGFRATDCILRRIIVPCQVMDDLENSQIYPAGSFLTRLGTDTDVGRV